MSRTLTLSLAFLTLLFTACATSPQRADVGPPSDGGHTERLTETVGVYTSKPWGFETRSYWVEGPDGVVLIDTQFLPSAALELAEAAEAATGKPVVTAIVLHANPDKFNGTHVLQKRGVEVLTSAQVLDLIPAVHTKRKGWFYERYAPDYPSDTPRPQSFGDTTTTVETAAGVTLTLHVVGPGCSRAHVIAQHHDHIFTGDLVANGHHSWLELGLIGPWLERVAEMQALEPAHVHPGRGLSGGPELLTQQAEYLRFVQRTAEGAGAASDPLAQTRDAILERYPAHKHAVFLRVGLPAVLAAVDH